MLAAVRMGLVIARTVNLLIARGILPADNRAAYNNPCTHWLGIKMNSAGGEVGADFMAFVEVMRHS